MKVDDVKKFEALVKKVYDSSEYVNRRKEMNRFMKYYKGEYWREKAKSDEETEIFCNYIFSSVQTVAPLLTDNRPIWFLRARKYFMQRFFEVYSEALEYLWDKLEMDMQVFKWVMDALIMKFGVAKIHWDGDEVAFEVEDPRSFVCAPGYDDVWKAPWCGTVYRKPVSWVREKYPETGKDIKPEGENGKPREDAAVDKMDSLDLENELVTVYEIWLRDETTEEILNEQTAEKVKVKKYPKGRILTLCQQKALADIPSPFRHGKPPYVLLYDYLVPHELVGMGEPDQIETLTLEFNLALRKMAQYVRDYVDPDWYIDSASGINPEKWKAERKGGENAWEINSGSNPPKVGEMPPINRTLVDFISGIPKLIEEVGGNTEISKGQVTKKQRQTAGEIATLIESSYTRTRQRVRNLEFSIKRSQYLVVDIMQQFYKKERPYTLVRDGQIQQGQVSNQSEFAKRVMTPGEQADPKEIEDYQKMVEYLGSADEVYVDFDMEIQTNSTLPMDRQSLGNLMLRLFELRAVDAEALLEILRVPKADEIVERLKQMEQAKQGPQVPQEAMNV